MALQYKFVPMDEWPLKATKTRDYARFKTGWTDTLNQLERELRQLNYRIGSVELHRFHRPYDVLKDGRLRSTVRMPDHPGVIIKFNRTVNNKIIAMQFASDRFLQWKDNVLAIARAMESLRMVDRYGVTSGRGEASQYEGFRQQLPPSINLGSGMTPEVAGVFLSRYAPGIDWTTILKNRDTFESVRKTAAMKAHPDRGGSHEDMAKVNQAVETLRQHFANQ